MIVSWSRGSLYRLCSASDDTTRHDTTCHCLKATLAGVTVDATALLAVGFVAVLTNSCVFAPLSGVVHGRCVSAPLSEVLCWPHRKDGPAKNLYVKSQRRLIVSSAVTCVRS